MKQLEVPVFVRRRIPTRNLFDTAANAFYRRIDFLTEGILCAEIRKTGATPRVVELSDPDEILRYSGPVTFVSINEPPALYSLLKYRALMERQFSALIIGGQIPGLRPNLVQRAFPEANLFRGEIEGHTARIIEDALSNVRGRVYLEAAADIYGGYTLPERRRWMLMSAVELGRGCPYHCDFCGLPGNHAKVRTRNPEQVIDELERLGPRLFFIDPNLSTYPPEYLQIIFEYLERKKKRWMGEGSIRELKERPELWELMSRTCISFLTGVESIDERNQAREKNGGVFLDQLNGAVVANSLIVGMPEQTEAEIERVICMVRERNLTALFHLLAPYPGTTGFRRLRERGAILEDNFLLFDRRHVVVSNPMGADRTMEMYKRARTECHTTLGTLKEMWRIIKEQGSFALKVGRFIALIALRCRTAWNSKNIPKNEAELPGQMISVSVND